MNPLYTSPEKPKLIEQSFRDLQSKRQRSIINLDPELKARKALKVYQ